MDSTFMMNMEMMVEGEPHFEKSNEVEGLNFGGQLAQRLYQLRRTGLADLQAYLGTQPQQQPPPPPPSSCGDQTKEGVEMDQKGKGKYGLVTYMPTEGAKRFQYAWHWSTMGLATPRSKVLLFFFDDSALLKRAIKLWPSTLRFHHVKPFLLHSLPCCEFARCKVRKGKLTFYVYAVKRLGQKFTGRHKFNNLINAINHLKDINDEDDNEAANMGEVLLKILYAVLLIAANIISIV